LKRYYLAAFTAALLNNQPMGFYHPSTIIKDAQRHGLKVKAVDVTRSEWGCTVEKPTVDGLRSTAVTPGGAGLQPCNPAHENFVASAAGGLWCGGDEVPQGLKPETFVPHYRTAEAVRHPVEAGDGMANDQRPSTIDLCVRLGLRYVRGLREEAARALVRERQQRPFESITDLVRRVPELRRTELETLAAIGALNQVVSGQWPVVSANDSDWPLATDHWPLKLHRRDALWQVAGASRGEGPLLRGVPEPDGASPLQAMDREERLVADFRGTGVTVGPHPMAYRRAALKAQGICSAAELEKVPNGQWVRAAGCVIARQRPGTARGFLFLSLEDETGIANAIVTPDLFEPNRRLLVGEKFLLIEGRLQNLDNVISVKAERVLPLRVTEAETRSHDFH
jgi:DNA polymerase III alpha subunit